MARCSSEYRFNQMGFWTNKEHRTFSDDAEDLAYAPSGGCVKMWFLGAGLALVPVAYGIRCLQTGHARFFGSRGVHLDLEGSAAAALSIACMAVGGFHSRSLVLGIAPKLEPWSYLLKIVASLTFLGGFGYAIYRIIV